MIRIPNTPKRAAYLKQRFGPTRKIVKHKYTVTLRPGDQVLRVTPVSLSTALATARRLAREAQRPVLLKWGDEQHTVAPDGQSTKPSEDLRTELRVCKAELAELRLQVKQLAHERDRLQGEIQRYERANREC